MRHGDYSNEDATDYRCDADFSLSHTFDGIPFHDVPRPLLENYQRVGYTNDLPNGIKQLSPLEEKPVGMLEMCKSQATRKRRGTFGVMYSEMVYRRLVDMVNQCRYIASKKGMDKRQLIESIKMDEFEGKTCLKGFQDAPWYYVDEIEECPPTTSISTGCAHVCQLNKCGKSRCHLNQGEDMLDSDGIISDLRHCYNNSQTRQFQENIYDEESEYLVNHVPRPPTQRSTTGKPLQSAGNKSLMDEMESGVFDDSDESDFDPSQTCDLLKKINFSNNNIMRAGLNENEDASNIILPIRTPATHNLCTLYNKNKNIEDNPNEGRNRSESESGSSDEEIKDLIITTARAKACASYVQLRNKRSEEGATHSKLPLFGNLGEFNCQISVENFHAIDEKTPDDNISK